MEVEWVFRPDDIDASLRLVSCCHTPSERRAFIRTRVYTDTHG